VGTKARRPGACPQFFDKDGNGEISVLELRTTMAELGGLLSEGELVAFLEVMDVNNDGVIGVSWRRASAR